VLHEVGATVPNHAQHSIGAYFEKGYGTSHLERSTMPDQTHIPETLNFQSLSLGSVAAFSGKNGQHRTLTEEECPGDTFLVFEAGAARGFRIRCQTCLREFVSYGNRVLDPMSDELATLRDELKSYAGVKVLYRYSRGTEIGTTELPAKWFQNVGNAYDMFHGTTQEAATLAWPHDSTDKLEIITVQFFQRGTLGWQLQQQREFRIL
jgi:hypothetical protein